jgi:hypothetical protein
VQRLLERACFGQRLAQVQKQPHTGAFLAHAEYTGKVQRLGALSINRAVARLGGGSSTVMKRKFDTISALAGQDGLSGTGMKRALALMLLVGVGTPALAEPPDTLTMVIDAGRLGVMMDQSQRILGLPDDPEQDGSTETAVVLRNAVKQYQRLLPVACARHVALNGLCEQSFYAPSWLNDLSTPAPEVLRARIDEATDRVAPLWNALCGTLPKDHDESLCQLE